MPVLKSYLASQPGGKDKFSEVSDITELMNNCGTDEYAKTLTRFHRLCRNISIIDSRGFYKMLRIIIREKKTKYEIRKFVNNF